MLATNGPTPEWHAAVGIVLALSSGVFIGTSLVLQKMGIISTESVRLSTGNEYAYLKSKMWWIGIVCMVSGELCNFGAYAFSPAIIVTPLGAVSVVVSAILSIAFLGERLNFSGVMGILLCIIGSIFIVLHAPPSTQTTEIPDFFSYVFAPGFIVYSILAIALLSYLVFRLGPLYGSTQPIIYLSITSIGGAFLVNAAQGLGSSIVYSISNPEDTQFKYWSIYPLIAFTLACAVFQINFLNKSLQYFSTSIVTPVNYVFFSTATLVTSAVLYRGFNVATASDAIQIIMGFLVIVIGVSLLFQYHLKLNRLEKARREAIPVESVIGDISGTSVDLDSMSVGNPSTVCDPRLSLSDPRSDIDPVTLWNQTFPFHQRILRRFSKDTGTSTAKDKDQESSPTVLASQDLTLSPKSGVIRSEEEVASNESPKDEVNFVLQKSSP